MKRFVREAVVFASVMLLFGAGKVSVLDAAWWKWFVLFILADLLIVNATCHWRTSGNDTPVWGKDVTDGRSD